VSEEFEERNLSHEDLELLMSENTPVLLDALKKKMECLLKNGLSQMGQLFLKVTWESSECIKIIIIQ
jgi:hypothetical protein